MAENSPELVAAKPQEEEWVGLIRRIAKGDQGALEAFYHASNRLVFGLSLRILADHASAEEATLEVYHQVWRRAGDFDPARGKVAAWLLTLTRSRAIDRRRSMAQNLRREPLDTLQDSHDLSANPEELSQLSEMRQRVRLALASLEPEQRQSIELAYFYGLSQSEIASRLGAPLGTIKTRMRTGMLRLKDCLND
ncbi:MAG: sigma-70 family RNA polymerase sigma factor [Acidobacteriota bacterium]